MGGAEVDRVVMGLCPALKTEGECIGTALCEQMPRQEGIVSSAAKAMPLLRGTISNNQSVAKEMEAINVGMQSVRMDHLV